MTSKFNHFPAQQETFNGNKNRREELVDVYSVG